MRRTHHADVLVIFLVGVSVLRQLRVQHHLRDRLRQIESKHQRLCVGVESQIREGANSRLHCTLAHMLRH
jgi:hypothetical protein